MKSNFHLKYWPLWDSLRVSLANAEYKPDTGFTDDTDLLNKKQVAATTLIQRISDNYNTYRIKSLKELGDYTPTYPEFF